MRHVGGPGAFIARQRGHLFTWVPVALACGIGIYFGLSTEPSIALLSLLFALLVGLLLVSRVAGESWTPLILCLCLADAGFLLAATRAHLQSAPVLEFRYHGPIQGRVIEIDRSLSDKTRLTLDQVVLSRVAPGRTPDRVRVSLHGAQGFIDPVPGMTVMMTGHLDAPGRPAEPGGFDFRRHAWFEKIGAVGYTRTPVLELEPPRDHSFVLRLHRFRMSLSAAIQARLDGQTGAFAAAVLTGDRSGLDRQTVDTMRDSNLAHLLAISGLHIGLLSGFVFAAVRVLIALSPPLALRVSGKKWGALVALVSAGIYLMLSGATVSTQRAFIMVAVMLCAVMLDRRALTLRAVALAAVIVLLLRPEALLGPGFQMSFAATTALVWVFSLLRHNALYRRAGWTMPIVTLVISSAVAGVATAPFAAAHFNQSATYGLIANLVSVPVMGTIVIPSAVLALCVAPLGLADTVLAVMGLGIDWILGVARRVSELDGAVRHIPSPMSVVLPLLTLGALWLILVRDRSRYAGIPAVVVALAFWLASERPDVLIADNGGLVGVRTSEGRALNKEKGQGYAARIWLENDGQGMSQSQAFDLAAPLLHDRVFRAEVGGIRLAQMAARTFRKHPDPCADTDILVVTVAPERKLACRVLSPDTLRQSGALALHDDGASVRVSSVQSTSGQRLWIRDSQRGTTESLSVLPALLSRENPPPPRAKWPEVLAFLRSQ